MVPEIDLRYKETKGRTKEIIIPTFFKNTLFLTRDDHAAATELAVTATLECLHFRDCSLIQSSHRWFSQGDTAFFFSKRL